MGGGDLNLLGSQDKTIKMWNVGSICMGQSEHPRAILNQRAHDKDINTLSISPNDKLAASASQDKTVKVLNQN